MARALELFHASAEERQADCRRLRDRLERALAGSCAPVVVNSARAPRLPNTLSIAFPGLDGDALLVALDLEGIACSLGSACASGSTEPAPALVAMNCPAEVLRSSIRFSVSIDNTLEEIDEAIAIISRTVHRLRYNPSPNRPAAR
jgi:cysteine desulfurase